MQQNLKVYNSLSSSKEKFDPLNPPYVGMYVCGPTVYSDVHLGNLRSFLSFDVIYRYLEFLGYAVRYVRNITDVGHLENDADEGEDKIAKKAKLENLEPMEVVHKYTQGFHEVARLFNLKRPSIEPSASGHIIEQIDLIQRILDAGFAYEVEGSVYFDVKKYHNKNHYGILSGRVLEDLVSGTRELDRQDEKRSALDFALWKKAAPAHIMRWPSPWSDGFPGWHLECSTMSTKYLGKQFDIHGGGLDLKFPHHECEIAQCVAGYGVSPAKYWMHGNMLTVNGQKMSKSVGNSILPHQLFTGEHPLLDKAYSPMTVRFFMLQTHYRSTLDLSNDALTAAAKGYKKLANGLRIIKQLQYPDNSQQEINQQVDQQINQLCENCYHAMNDDFNTAKTIAHLFNLLKKINSIHNGTMDIGQISSETFTSMKSTFLGFTEQVLGLQEERLMVFDPLLNIVLNSYQEAKERKDYTKVDAIREQLKTQGIVLKDMKTGVDWAYEE
ncbi:MAG: cysteine--tRNA ligase [Cyclobacteriaceae bacterium]|nr:MAG: cysteine--tRNA ligase [Cyclobacteriaceae bacterium]